MTVAVQHGTARLPWAPGSMSHPRRGLTGEAAAVAAVDELLAATMRALVEHWQDLSPADRRSGSLQPDSVLQLLRESVGSGGKRLRPRMTYWGWVAAGGECRGQGRGDMLMAATALELLHAFALVHDDVMDASEERRGHPSVHARARTQHRAAGGLGAAERYGESIAILVGDLLHSEADVLAARLPAALRSAWRTMSIELIAGQTRDLVGAATGRRDLEHARQVAATKSGAYTAWRPLQLGALAAGAGADTLAALRSFGLHLGEAFALRDDILGVLGDPARTGKPVGDDIVAGKPTVLLALAEQRFP
ncbi:MAG: polyprenyl synthetase family protein, partial [Candidatus Nanopelagicales bacterium]